MTFLEALTNGPCLLMDGAMGTQLIQAGLPEEECGEGWNLTRPGAVLAIHRAYRQAGANVLLTNTFQANLEALARRALDERLDEILLRAESLARQAGGRDHYTLADVGPIPGPDGQEFSYRPDLAAVLTAFQRVDGYLLETCSSPNSLSAVEFARHRVLGVDSPVLLSLTYLRRGAKLVTYSGHAPATYARHAARHGVTALGVNCGLEIGRSELLEILNQYRAETDLPLFVRPNAGTPSRAGGALVYPHGPEEMASWLPDFLAAGVRMVGGCCGTTPEHIAAFRRVLGPAGP